MESGRAGGPMSAQRVQELWVLILLEQYAAAADDEAWAFWRREATG